MRHCGSLFLDRRGELRFHAVAINTSLFPTIRLFDLEGDSIRSFGTAPPDWEPVTAPPVSDLSAPGSRERLEEWSRSFTVVRQIAAVADSVLVVQYGRNDLRETDPYHVAPTTADVYSADGDKLAEGLNLPGPWTVSVLEWRGHPP